MQDILTCYIGYDVREHDAYEVTVNSLRRHASRPVRIVKLEQSILRDIGLYRRGMHMENGQRYDNQDGKPFSTEFSYSRFAVPMLNMYQGWAIFVDCDFLFTDDIYSIFEDIATDQDKAVYVVKHDQRPVETTKMDNCVQAKYARKNWSSFILWNCEHPAHKKLGPMELNTADGSWLHQFRWLEDNEIGELNPTWNYLSGVQPQPARTPKSIHYTLGGPWFDDYKNVPFAGLWVQEFRDMKAKK